MSNGPQTGERVVLGHRESKMVDFKRSGNEPLEYYGNDEYLADND
jgi:hypothetical protein